MAGSAAVRIGYVPEAAALRYTGWAVLVSLAGYLYGWAMGILWMAAGGVFGPLSDLAALFTYGPLVLVAWTLHRIYRTREPAGSWLVLGVGWSGMFLSMVSGVGLILYEMAVLPLSSPALLAGQMAGVAVAGLWLLGVSVLELRVRALGRRIALAGIAAGVGSVLLGVSSLLWGLNHPLFALGSLIALIGTILWAVWLGRRFLGGLQPLS